MCKCYYFVKISSYMLDQNMTEKINIVKKINQSILLLSYTECKCYWKCAVVNFIDYQHAGFTFSKSVPQVIRINNIVFYCQSCSTNPIPIRMNHWNDMCVCGCHHLTWTERGGSLSFSDLRKGVLENVIFNNIFLTPSFIDNSHALFPNTF